MAVNDFWRMSLSVPVRQRPVKPERIVLETPELAQLQSALAAIPQEQNPLDYDDWRNVGFALHYATEGSDEGLALLHEFSARSGKYDAEFIDNRFWPYVGVNSAEPITSRTLFSLAKQHGWEDPTVIDDFDVLQEDETPNKLRFAPIPVHQFAVPVKHQWLVKGVLPMAELAVLYGDPGSGKSFMALDISTAISQGLPWRGHRVHQGDVVYIAAEGANGFRNRLRAYSQFYEVSLENLPFHVIHAAPNMLEKADALDVAKAILNVVGQPKIIIVDTLAQTMPGGNENSGEDMGAVLAHCKGLNRATGALVMLIHHSGKDAGKGARGWSGLRGEADVELEVIRDGHDRVLSVTKQKDGEDGNEFGFRLQVVALGHDDDGDEVSSCVVVGAEVVPKQIRQAIKGANQKLVMSVFEEILGLAPDDDLVEREKLIAAVVDQIPLEEGKRDRRRDTAVRAIEKLREADVLQVEGARLRKNEEL